MDWWSVLPMDSILVKPATKHQSLVMHGEDRNAVLSSVTWAALFCGCGSSVNEQPFDGITDSLIRASG